MSHLSFPWLIQEETEKVRPGAYGGILFLDGVTDDATVGFKGQLALRHRVDFLLAKSWGTGCCKEDGDEFFHNVCLVQVITRQGKGFEQPLLGQCDKR